MDGLLAQLLPIALVGAISPLPIVITISLLPSPRGLAKGICFGLALTGVFAAVGVVTLAGAGTNAGATDTGSAVTGTIVAVLGAVLIVIALKLLFEAPDPDAPPPKFMARLDSMSPAGAAGFGALIAVINVKQLGIYAVGLAQIVDADVSAGEGWLALIVLLVVIQAGVIAVLLTYVLGEGVGNPRARRVPGLVDREQPRDLDRAWPRRRRGIRGQGRDPDRLIADRDPAPFDFVVNSTFLIGSRLLHRRPERFHA